MNNQLNHHGIKGQKWGVRRFQNEDGSLTPAGKKQYRKELIKKQDAEERILKEKRLESLHKTNKTSDKVNKWQNKNIFGQVVTADREHNLVNRAEKYVSKKGLNDIQALSKAKRDRMALKASAYIAGSAIVAYSTIKLFKEANLYK